MIFLSECLMFEKVSQEAKELVFVLDGIGRKADPLAEFYGLCEMCLFGRYHPQRSGGVIPRRLCGMPIGLLAPRHGRVSEPKAAAEV